MAKISLNTPKRNSLAAMIDEAKSANPEPVALDDDDDIELPAFLRDDFAGEEVRSEEVYEPEPEEVLEATNEEVLEAEAEITDVVAEVSDYSPPAVVQSHTQAEVLASAKKVVEDARTLLKNIDNNAISFSLKLTDIVSDKILMESLGYEASPTGFEEMCTREFSITGRSGRRYFDVGVMCKTMELTPDDVNGIRFSKLAQIASLRGDLLSQHCDHLLDKARTSNVDEINAEIRKIKGKPQVEGQGKITRLSLPLYEEQSNLIETAIAATGSDNRSKALERIVADWLVLSTEGELELARVVEVLQERNPDYEIKLIKRNPS